MIKETITYTDFNGKTRTDDFYFHFSEAELLEMELSTDGGLSEKMKKVSAAEDHKFIVKIMKEVILKAYGEKSDDGKRFVKTPEMAEAFAQTEAYSNLFMELAFDDKKAAKFFNSLIIKKDAKIN